MNERIVIADASCLIVLERIGALDLLRRLFTEITVTTEVKNEIGEDFPARIKIVEVKDAEKTNFLKLNLDEGEASSIAYCLEQSVETLLVIDEKKGRRIARELGVKTIGTLGLIVQARENKIIDSVKEILIRMENADFRIASNLKIEILKRFDE